MDQRLCDPIGRVGAGELARVGAVALRLGGIAQQAADGGEQVGGLFDQGASVSPVRSNAARHTTRITA